MPSKRYSATELLTAVQASPAAVAAHDRAAWVGLFAADGEVNDPVGSRPHKGHDAIQRFYDTFIAPNTMVFHVEHDIVCGMSVMRDLAIETTMSTGARLSVPMHLRYDLVDESGALRIRRLYAHWELTPMVRQMLGSGAKGLGAALRLCPQMLRHQGVGGALGFARGFAGVGSAGKHLAEAFLDALSHDDAAGARTRLAPGATLEWPFGNAVTAERFVAQARGLHAGKLLAAGRSVTSTLTLADGRRGVALIHFNAALRIGSVQIFI